MRGFVRLGLAAAVTAACAATAVGQTAPAPEDQMSRLLVVYREEVKAGKSAAHQIHENAWANAYRKAGLPMGWIGSASVTGPSEAWFFTPVESYEQFEKVRQGEDSHPTYASESARLSEKDAENVSRTSTLLLARRPAMSYQARVNMAEMRYIRVEIHRVKRGYNGEFWDGWREVVAAHEKAKMDEHWAVYEVTSGMPDGTFMFFYPLKSMTDIDKAAPMHGAAEYRDALGEDGRGRMRDMNREAVEWSQSFILALDPQMSVAPREWSATDPFWTLKPTLTPARQ